MSVRKRNWTNAKGKAKSVWVVDYKDVQGVRRQKKCGSKKEADDFAATVKVEVRDGTHVADGASETVRQAGAHWIASAERARLERSTINQRKRHLRLHIAPLLGDTPLNKITPQSVRAFEDSLRNKGQSVAMMRKVRDSLGSILADALERGKVTRNPVREVRSRRRTGSERTGEKRRTHRLAVGRDIPTLDEVRALVTTVKGRWRPLLLVAVMTGRAGSGKLDTRDKWNFCLRSA